jgi:hypothetical protein
MARLELLRAAIRDAEWMTHLLSWRRSGLRPTVTVDLSPGSTALPLAGLAAGNGHDEMSESGSSSTPVLDTTT